MDMKMDMRYFFLKSVSIFFIMELAACTPEVSATPYLPPTPAPRVTLLPTPTSTLPPGVPTPVCIDNLAFRDDLTIPDYSVVFPGSLLDKQWLVQNTGSCNWDERYRLRMIGGYPMGAAEEQALYPARAGAEAVIRILFTAPSEAGEYVSLWQAYDPNGFAFGEAFLIKIIVQP
jgi:hypothetical protein